MTKKRFSLSLIPAVGRNGGYGPRHGLAEVELLELFGQPPETRGYARPGRSSISQRKRSSPQRRGLPGFARHVAS